MSAAPFQSDAPETLLNVRIPATEGAVTSALTDLQGTLVRLQIADDTMADVQLAMAEILNNIVEHSVAGIADAIIAIDIVRTATGIFVETEDRGRPLPPSLLASAELPMIGPDIDSLPEGGFGWFIIHSLAQDMVYEREAGMNRLSFSFPLARS